MAEDDAVPSKDGERRGERGRRSDERRDDDRRSDDRRSGDRRGTGGGHWDQIERRIEERREDHRRIFERRQLERRQAEERRVDKIITTGWPMPGDPE
jgi:hypothetical protein